MLLDVSEDTEETDCEDLTLYLYSVCKYANGEIVHPASRLDCLFPLLPPSLPYQRMQIPSEVENGWVP